VTDDEDEFWTAQERNADWRVSARVELTPAVAGVPLYHYGPEIAISQYQPTDKERLDRRYVAFGGLSDGGLLFCNKAVMSSGRSGLET
jgi:hypothetical protein